VILNYRVADLVLGPGQDGKKIAPEGMKVSGMSDKQKAMLLDLIKECAGIMNDGTASARMAQLKAELNNTWFAWSGSTSFKTGTNIAAYYRIQGPHLVIENAPQDDESATISIQSIAIPQMIMASSSAHNNVANGPSPRYRTDGREGTFNDEESHPSHLGFRSRSALWSFLYREGV
jgi:hypothetical protein